MCFVCLVCHVSCAYLHTYAVAQNLKIEEQRSGGEAGVSRLKRILEVRYTDTYTTQIHVTHTYIHPP